MTNFSMPVVMGQLAAGNQALSQLDTDYDAVARMGTYMCSATGTNTVTLTALTGYPAMTAYGNIQKIGFIASATSTSLVQIVVSPLATLNAYQNNGSTQITTGNIVAGSYYEFAYNSTLNSSAGGWQQITPTFVSTAIQSVVLQKFTTSGTYTPTANMVDCIIECIAGGGAGGGVATSSNLGTGGGGGAGSYSRSRKTAAQIGVSQSVTVGGGGTAGSAGNNPGNAGSDTSVGVLVVAKGGLGGGGAAANSYGFGSAGGVAGTGDVTGTGMAGWNGVFGAGTVGSGQSGAGGATTFGAGGQSLVGASNGDAGKLYGGGGGGGLDSGSGGNKTGGAGAAGIVIITEYCS